MRRCIVLLCMLVSFSAYADEPPPHWEFNLTPYFWFGSDDSTFSKVVPRGSPPLNGKADISNIVPHLDTVPISGVAEVRYGRFGLAVDIIALSTTFGTRLTTPPFIAGTAKVSNIQSAALGFYRVFKAPEQYVDVGGGVRVWNINNTLTFGPVSLPSHLRLANPILAIHYHHALPAKFGISLYGDIGGGIGGARLTYQMVATVDYTMTNWLVLHAGYRHSYFDYRNQTINVNASMSGPLIGATFRF